MNVTYPFGTLLCFTFIIIIIIELIMRDHHHIAIISKRDGTCFSENILTSTTNFSKKITESLWIFAGLFIKKKKVNYRLYKLLYYLTIRVLQSSKIYFVGNSTKSRQQLQRKNWSNIVPLNRTVAPLGVWYFRM